MTTTFSCRILAFSLLIFSGLIPQTRAQSSETPNSRVLLLLKRSPQQRAAVQQLLGELQDLHSPRYHKWLKPADYGRSFGATDQQISQIRKALAKHNLVLSKVGPHRTAFEVSGPRDQLRYAFLSASTNALGKKRMKRVIPADLSDFIEAVAIGGRQPAPASTRSIVMYDQKKHVFRRMASALAAQDIRENPRPMLSGTESGVPFYGVTPGDLAVQYSLPRYVQGQDSSINGYGGVVGVISDYNINLSYLNSYGNTFGITMPTYHVIVDGSDPGVLGGPSPTYFELEAIGAVAPATTVNLYTADTDEIAPGRDLSFIRAVADDSVNVLLYPYQGCEADLGSETTDNGYDANAENNILSFYFEAAAAEGISVVTPAGDLGSAACDQQFSDAASTGLAVNGAASTPYATAVGGTDFYYGAQGTATQSTYDQYWSNSTTAYTTLMSYVPEQAWNDSNQATDQLSGYSYLLAGGGGVSTVGLTDEYGTTHAPYPQPWWQMGLVPATISQTARVVPDIALFAGDYTNNSAFVFCAAGTDCSTNNSPDASNLTFTSGSGTEVSAAVFAGIMALVVGEHDAQGNANPTLYAMSHATSGVFNDVIYGTNSVVCSAGSPNCTNGLLVDQNGQPGYAALSGYDAATGLGSINATALVQQWSPPNTSPSSSTLAIVNPSTNQPIRSFVHGTAVTINSTVIGSGGTPTGDVSILTGAAQTGSGIYTLIHLSEGSGTEASTIYLPGGTYQVFARYGGDATYQPSISSAITLTVSPVACVIDNFYQNIQSGASIPYGTQVAMTLEPFNANNSSDGTSATGSITVKDNGTTITTFELDLTGAGVFRDANFLPGSHQLSFVYAGDPSFQSCSLNSALNFTVTATQTTTSVTSSLSTVPSANGYYALTAVVTPNTTNDQGLFPSGTFTFTRSDGTVLASRVPAVGFYSGLTPAAQGVAYLGGGTLAAGTNSITATFVPASTTGYAASSSSPISVALGNATGLAVSSLTLSTGDGGNTYFNTMPPVTVNASVSGSGVPTGSVVLYVNGAFAANMAPNGAGQWTYVFDGGTTQNGLLPLPIGQDAIVAQYSGDAANTSDYANLNLTILDSQLHPDFTILSPVDYKAVHSGTTTASFTVKISPVNGLTGAVYFGVAAPGQISCNIPDHVNLTKQYITTTLSCSNIPTAPGRYVVDVIASSGVQSNTPNINTSIGHDLPLQIIVQ